MEELIVSLHKMNLQNPGDKMNIQNTGVVQDEPTKEVLCQAVQYLFNENMKLKEEIERLRQHDRRSATPTIPLWMY